jgi:argininosuccinate lyase
MPSRFDPEYIAAVLDENFEDAKAHFLEPLMRIHYAHLVMLAEQRIVSAADAAAIRAALDAIPLDEVRRAPYDGTCEDLFFYVERLITDRCGDEAAGRLHTARSRNDIDMTMYRMRQRALILTLAGAVVRLRGVLIALADQHRTDVFAAHTHTQPAQPTTVAHYLEAVIEQLERDSVRLRAAFASTNLNPLGSCAITGTGFPIDRHRTSALLGFDGPTGNTYGSIATVDYLLESVSAAGVLLAGLGRVIQDLLLWCTTEFGYLRLGDGFVQTSSIMPQKRNPVALEHARALASTALGRTAAVLIAVHNTPFGDIVDTEDDLQPMVVSTFTAATRAVRLVSGAMASAVFDTARLAERAEQGWITVTELADTLTRDHGVPFRAGHAIAARFVSACGARHHDPRAAILREVSTAVIGRAVEYDEASLARVLSARHFVDVRTTHGGPAPAEIDKAIARSRARLGDDERWVEESGGRLRSADEALTRASAAL